MKTQELEHIIRADEEIAREVRAMAASVRKLVDGPLRLSTLVTLIHYEVKGTRGDIERILGVLLSLDARTLKPKKEPKK